QRWFASVVHLCRALQLRERHAALLSDQRRSGNRRRRQRAAPFPLEQLCAVLPGRLESAAKPDAEFGAALRVLRCAQRKERSDRQFHLWTKWRFDRLES